MPKIHSAQISVFSLAFTMLLSTIGVSIPNIALPSISKHFHTLFSQTQLIIIGYLLSLTVFTVVAGKTGDIFGRKRILLDGIILFSLAALASGLAQSLWMIVLARIAQGIGAAILMSMSFALISGSSRKDKIGSSMGLMGTMSAIGTASGPTVGGFLINNYGWRSVFFLMSIMGIFCFIFAKLFIVPEQGKRHPETIKFDFLGMLFLGIFLACYSLGVTLNSGLSTEQNWAFLAVSMLSLFAFIKTEKRSPNPLVSLEIFNKTLYSNLFMNIIVSTVMMSTLVVGPFYLSLGLGLTPLKVGTVMSVGPLISIITGIPSGKAVDTLGVKFMTKFGLILMTLGTTALFILSEIYGLYGYVFSIFILSPGYQIFQASNNTAVMKKVSEKNRGLISGLLNLSRNIGLISGASFMGSIFSFTTGVADISSAPAMAVALGMKSALFAATILLLIALSIAFFSTNRKDLYEHQLP